MHPFKQALFEIGSRFGADAPAYSQVVPGDAGGGGTAPNATPSLLGGLASNLLDSLPSDPFGLQASKAAADAAIQQATEAAQQVQQTAQVGAARMQELSQVTQDIAAKVQAAASQASQVQRTAQETSVWVKAGVGALIVGVAGTLYYQAQSRQRQIRRY
jgi:hypothetical protein